MKYITALLLLFTALSCSDNPADPEYNSEYFPLEQGNWWKYSGSLEMNILVSSREIINDREYYILIRSFPSSSDTLRLRYEKNDRLLILFEGQEFLYIDFSLPAGSTWDTYYNFYGEVRNKGLNYTVPAGIFNNVTEILFENTLISDVYEFNKYAPGAGMISSSGFRRSFNLASAQVNGKIYP